MKGNNTFTILQIQKIKKLITEKVFAPPDKQKSIRAKIRSIGFHYSDFSSKKDGYTISDFDQLIHSGQIKISVENYIPAKTEIIKIIDQPNPVENKIKLTPKSKGFNTNLDIFKVNRFDPKTDSDTMITNSSGNYILCLRKNSKLPSFLIKPIMTNFEGLQVIYTGISSGNVS